ncbi:hypothetical protein [Marinobacterium sedimentorum]|uniref:hypothetical protein n=1 Tax=Marinobacterium sedimentorum TaxID=2927804 RepID=UPI0020C6C6BE|nr:hypothetical protein [Marinobacterium sedimentorum]MCP8690227.1 hypothetical protein [Marinobacterium sedimentorum]
MKRSPPILLTLLLALVLSACATQKQERPFQMRNLAKSDIDMVTDAHIAEVNRLSRELMLKLYRRNPRELAKAPPGTTIAQRMYQLFEFPRKTHFRELNNHYGIHAVPLAFDPAFEGDRVLALMVGISGMIHSAYNGQDEFFLLDEIDQQKLYNSARNLEKIAWQLNNARQANGELFLYSNGLSEVGIGNLSFARTFGKLIALQDMMARIVADTQNRTINKVLQGAASTVLLPI